MTYFGFIASNARWLASGFLLSFASAFGQTFFISLFSSELRAELGLSHGEFGTLYAVGTLSSAALLLSIGGLADSIALRRLALVTMLALAASCVAMAMVASPWMLVAVIFALRFSGQGMLSHLSLTATGRWFQSNRGRALAIAMLGFAISEAAWPSLVVLLKANIGWRTTWLVAAAIAAFAYAPSIGWLMARNRLPQSIAASDVAAARIRQWRRSEVLRDPRFYALLPGVLAMPFIGTGLIFHQVALVESKGWTLIEFTRGYPAYALASVAFSIMTGWAIDRFGSPRLMPFYLLPMAAALIVLAFGQSPAAGALGLVLFGISAGAVATVHGAIWAELYGTDHLGAIRTLSISGMVFATALSPSAMGLLLDAGIDLPRQYLGMAAYIGVVSAAFAVLSPRLVASSHR